MMVSERLRTLALLTFLIIAGLVLLSFEFFARRDDLWGSPLGCGRPLRPACPRAGICEGCEHAGLGGRRSPRGCPTRLFTSRWRPRPSFKLSAICGLPLCGAGFSQALARPFRSGSTARQANQWLWQEKGHDHLAPNSPEFWPHRKRGQARRNTAPQVYGWRRACTAQVPAASTRTAQAPCNLASSSAQRAYNRSTSSCAASISR